MVEKLDKFLNKVVQGDCLEIMPKIPAKSLDMILCDLPYGTTQNKWDSVIDLKERCHCTYISRIIHSKTNLKQ
jgi:DNA modification methylase